MLPAAAPAAHVTPEEYLAFDRASELPHEYVDGEIRAMTEGSRAHAVISARILASLVNQLRGRPCEAMGHVMRVGVPVGRDYLYPDVVVSCGGTRLEDEERDTMLNPSVIVEVLSPSTSDYDQVEKWMMYRRIPSLQDYLMVWEDEPRVERYTRFDDRGAWLFEESTGVGNYLNLQSIGCALRMTEIYERVFPAE